MARGIEGEDPAVAPALIMGVVVVELTCVTSLDGGIIEQRAWLIRRCFFRRRV